MLALVLLISLEVFLRFALDFPLDWIVEIASLLFVWMSMLGAAAAVPMGAHMALRPWSNRLGRTGDLVLGTFVKLMVHGYGIFLLVTGIEYVRSVLGQNCRLPNFRSRGRPRLFQPRVRSSCFSACSLWRARRRTPSEALRSRLTCRALRPKAWCPLC